MTMSTVLRCDPFKEVVTVRDRMNRMFNDVWGHDRRADEDCISGSWMASVDVRETKDALEITAELPGLESRDVEVTVENGILTLTGSWQFQKATEGKRYHRVECAYGSFERSFSLPTNVASDKAKAVCRHGVLHLTLPKREEAQPESISIKVQGN
jgi:HSP20 family protein